jgi:hypothetical protein
MESFGLTITQMGDTISNSLVLITAWHWPGQAISVLIDSKGVSAVMRID